LRQLPRTKPGHVIQVDGTVTKFESGLSMSRLRLHSTEGAHIVVELNEQGKVIDLRTAQ